MIILVIRSLTCWLTKVRMRGNLRRSLAIAICLVCACTGINAQTPFATKTTLAVATDFWVGTLQGSDGNFYTTTGAANEACQDNPANDCSAIYKIAADGTVSTFHAFQEVPPYAPGPGSVANANADGLQPTSFIEAADGNFYGTTKLGGSAGIGTIFKITPAGVFSVLYTFTPDANSNYLNGSNPNALVQGSDGNLYGLAPIASAGGIGYAGAFFQITLSGVFTLLHYFPDHMSASDQNFDYPEGQDPTSLVQGDDGNFYVTMRGGYAAGGTNNGFINKITPGGAVTVVHIFASSGSEGAAPLGPLVEGSDGSLYGVTSVTLNNPTNLPDVIFKMTQSGSLTSLHQFSGGTDGRLANGDLFLGSDGNLYGTARFGGDASSANCSASSGCGTVYQVQPSGTFTVAHAFEGGAATSYGAPGDAAADGASPQTPLTQGQSGAFYGTTLGGPSSSGTFYSLALTNAIPAPVQLTFSQTQVQPNTPVNLTWQVLNAFSMTAQQCHASIMGSPLGAGNWSGPQRGSLTGNVYTGTATITPTVGGSYIYVLNCGGNEIGTATLTVSGVTIITTTLPDGVVSIPYNATVQATGGITPYTWGFSGAVPAGLSLQATASNTTINVTGTPTQFGKYQVMIGVQDSSTPPQTGLQTFTFNVASGLLLVGSLNNGVVGTVYNTTAAATGGLPPYKWSLTSGKLPSGVTLNASSGVLFGTPTVPGKYTFSITVTDSEGTPATFAQSYTVSTVVPPLTVTPGTFSDCTVNVLCQGQNQATGGTPPYTWSIEPGTTFPPGLTLASSGAFTGLPTQYNCIPPNQVFGVNSTLSVQVSDSSTPPLTATGFGSLCILSGLNIVSISLPVATVGLFYQAPPPVATGGLPPYTWKITASSAQFVQEFGVNPAIGALYSIPGGPITPATDVLTYTLTDSEVMPAASEKMDATLTVVPVTVTSVTTISSSNASAGVGMPVILTAKATASGSTPTGVVTFYNGSSVIGTATLDATGAATLSTSFSTPGVYSLTAAYGGSGAITGSVSSALTETVVTVGVSSSVSPASLTITRGSSGTLTLTVTPMGGYTGAVNLSCGTLPQNVTCTFVPPSLTLTAGSGPVTDTLTIRTASTQSATLSLPSASNSTGSPYLGLPLWLPGLFTMLAGLFRRDRRSFRLSRIAIVCLALMGIGALTGCGGGSSQDARPGSYTIPVTLTLTGGTTQTVSATVIIQ